MDELPGFWQTPPSSAPTARVPGALKSPPLLSEFRGSPRRLSEFLKCGHPTLLPQRKSTTLSMKDGPKTAALADPAQYTATGADARTTATDRALLPRWLPGTPS